jgi:hypothetical protein
MVANDWPPMPMAAMQPTDSLQVLKPDAGELRPLEEAFTHEGCELLDLNPRLRRTWDGAGPWGRGHGAGDCATARAITTTKLCGHLRMAVN